jgi:hypothetical protein
VVSFHTCPKGRPTSQGLKSCIYCINTEGPSRRRWLRAGQGILFPTCRGAACFEPQRQNLSAYHRLKPVGVPQTSSQEDRNNTYGIALMMDCSPQNCKDYFPRGGFGCWPWALRPISGCIPRADERSKHPNRERVPKKRSPTNESQGSPFCGVPTRHFGIEDNPERSGVEQKSPARCLFQERLRPGRCACAGRGAAWVKENRLRCNDKVGWASGMMTPMGLLRNLGMSECHAVRLCGKWSPTERRPG